MIDNDIFKLREEEEKSFYKVHNGNFSQKRRLHKEAMKAKRRKIFHLSSFIPS